MELQGSDGTPIPGFTLAECTEQIGNELERIVTWKNSGDKTSGELASHAGKPVRLRFVLKDADLYSLRFVP